MSKLEARIVLEALISKHGVLSKRQGREAKMINELIRRIQKYHRIDTYHFDWEVHGWYQFIDVDLKS